MTPETAPSLAPSPNPPAPGESLALILSRALAVAERPEADKITGAHTLAGETLAIVFGVSAAALTESLATAAADISGGNLTGLEGTLASQAATLNGLFHLLTRHTFREPRGMDEISTFLKLAFRAQAQSTRALEVLATIKQGPRVIVAGQLNTAHQQVVNNAGTRETEFSRPRRKRATADQHKAIPESSTIPYYAPMDTRSPRKAAPEYSPLDPVDEIHRAPHGKRETEEQP